MNYKNNRIEADESTYRALLNLQAEQIGKEGRKSSLNEIALFYLKKGIQDFSNSDQKEHPQIEQFEQTGITEIDHQETVLIDNRLAGPSILESYDDFEEEFPIHQRRQHSEESEKISVEQLEQTGIEESDKLEMKSEYLDFSPDQLSSFMTAAQNGLAMLQEHLDDKHSGQDESLIDLDQSQFNEQEKFVKELEVPYPDLTTQKQRLLFAMGEKGAFYREMMCEKDDLILFIAELNNDKPDFSGQVLAAIVYYNGGWINPHWLLTGKGTAFRNVPANNPVRPAGAYVKF